MSRKTMLFAAAGMAVGLLGYLWLGGGNHEAAPPLMPVPQTESVIAAEVEPLAAQGTQREEQVEAPPPEDDAALRPAKLQRFIQLCGLTRALSEDEALERERLQAEVQAWGADAVLPLLSALRSAEPSVRDRLFNVLRQLPGPQVETALIQEALTGAQASTRSMAFETLGTLKTDAAMRALAQVAEHDPDLPAQPLIAQPRDPNDTSTELPDEQVFTPRMQAMAALAETKDPRAAAVLSQVARTGPDESLRMEAARHLASFRDDPQALEALRVAAGSDPSAYVRLAALHSLQDASDPSLTTLVERIARHDQDAGVRLLAQQVYDNLAAR